MVVSEMRLSAAAPKDVPATYFVHTRVSERRQSEGCLGSLLAPWGACPKKASLHNSLLVELRTSDALLNFSFLDGPMGGAS